MTALKSGDRKTAESLLIRNRNPKTKEADLTINPPGSAKMQSRSSRFNFLTCPANQRHSVSCEISDVNADGKEEKHEHLWALRE